ncbi:MgtC/SapB family protein [Aurantimonas aggregata]|uniref:Protein MgtC n=1 Tax=Aurantimonas aggregata TaxID=2047720 RepID=A0A6L9MCP3_9HYPH|nr:MgtC/SapB family protein [Aurantimonas aggregata]NDV85583.1 MgtC/SapB family protein [Aurantimonas aggregata]
MNELIEPGLWSTALTQASRLATAAVLTGAIGFERERHDHSAGLRTHMLVGIGACVFTLLMVQLIQSFDGDDIRSDPVRIVEAITAGVAFLAAGAIIQARGQVKGLTTGASLWLAGAVGLACGLGDYVLAIIAVTMTLIILRLVKLLE